MSINPLEEEKNFTSSLITTLTNKYRGETPTKENVVEIANKLAEIQNYNGNLQTCVDEARRSVVTRMGGGTSLVNKEANHDDEWVSKRENIEWIYSSAYEQFLRGESWPPSVVQSLSDVNMRILGHLQDPTSEGQWDRRGLVIGHVQSGKTANYMGLIARAADAQYKFIIVIAGIHNNLRKQTQERIDEGFVGRSSNPENRARIGVGLDPRYPCPATLTNINNDFSKSTAEQSGWRINDFSKPIIIVIKKNVSTLKSLHNWLKDMNAEEGDQISDVPMLMIDDEADHASINTNKPDIDPTRTNSMIRKILKLFDKSCYIGYTATPFANIFINPKAYDEEVREELFPRDFIYCLDSPSSYFGPEIVFLDDETNSRIVAPIEDGEQYIPLSHKKFDTIPDLPPSLYSAINGFIVARAIRNLRGHGNKHCSMMVNVSRFVDIQQSVKNFISLHTKKLHNSVKANYAMPENIALQNPHMQALREAFLANYAECGFEWRKVKAELFKVLESLRLYVVNSKSDEALDYKKYEKDGHALTALAVGGLSLSRGLTIEGLCTSYMYRNTRTYDTLMQMGRWFGYRSGYEDLCKVYLSPDSAAWYAYIANASEELRQQIKKMRRDGLNPEKFGLYVKSHPDSLLITAANKMRSGEKIFVKQNLSGSIIESFILPTDESINEKNENIIKEFWKSGFGGKLKKTEKGWTVQDVPFEVIEKFLIKFQTHKLFHEKKEDAINFLQEISEKYPKGDVLLISMENKGENEKLYRLGTQLRTVKSIETDYVRVRNRRVATQGDERLGLTNRQKREAEEAKILKEEKQEKEAKTISDKYYREVRDKPLLMIHVLRIETEDDPKSKKRVPAFGVSFPPGDYETEIEVVANPVLLDIMLGATDDPDEEEDYDA